MHDLRLLLQFFTVARLLSFTEAAREIGVAQPWLSARIRKLEHQLGFALFERSSRRVSLTLEGTRLAALVEPLATVAELVNSGIADLTGGMNSRLRIGVHQLGEIDHRQNALIARFVRTYPKVSVEVEPGVAAVQFDRLRRGLIDVLLTPRPVDAAEWQSLTLHPIRVAMMMRQHDPLTHHDHLTSVHLTGRRVATFSPVHSPEFYDLVYGQVIAAGAVPEVVPELRRSLLKDDSELLVSTLVPSEGNKLLRHGLVRMELTDLPPFRLQVVVPQSRPMSRMARLFWTMAKQSVEECS